MMRHPIVPAVGWAVLTVSLAAGVEAWGQDAKRGEPAQAAGSGKTFDSREAVNIYYADRYADLERQHIADLAKVAAKETGEAAGATYRLLFDLAIARNLYDAAEPAAEKVIESGSTRPDVVTLAHFINVIAEADRGEYDESLQDLQNFIKARAGQAPADPTRQADPNTVLAIGEAYFQRLVQAGRYDIAKKVCELAMENATNPMIKQHFSHRLSRIGMLGKPAPDINGTDVDGKPVKLADLKGKVVLVNFWATWCPPCSLDMLRLNALAEKYKDKDFAVLGVNLDALREGVQSADAVMPIVRRYLVDHQVSWPNVLNGTGDRDFAKAYGVTEIPANFLIGKDGNIIQFELGEASRAKAVDDALGGNGPKP